MQSVLELITAVLRDLWQALAAGLLAVAGLAVLAAFLRLSLAAAAGAAGWARQALAGLIGPLFLSLIAFLAGPALVQALAPALPSAGCGPISELGALAGGLCAGLAALRILAAFLSAAVSAGLGGRSALSAALAQAGEAGLALLLAAAAFPVAAHFLGAC